MRKAEVSIKTRSPPASLSFKGQATKQETVKWSICSVHWDEIRRSNNRCVVPRENHSRGVRKQRIPPRLFAVLDAIGATCHVMSKWPLELLLSGSFYLNFHSTLLTEEMVLMHVHSLLYCWPNFIFSISLVFQANTYHFS